MDVVMNKQNAQNYSHMLNVTHLLREIINTFYPKRIKKKSEAHAQNYVKQKGNRPFFYSK